MLVSLNVQPCVDLYFNFFSSNQGRIDENYIYHPLLSKCITIIYDFPPFKKLSRSTYKFSIARIQPRDKLLLFAVFMSNMNLSDILKSGVYAIVFGFMGMIIGIWTADLLYSIVLKNIDRVSTIYLSVGIIVLIVVCASILGFTKGKNLME